jgi:hypothetical protein
MRFGKALFNDDDLASLLHRRIESLDSLVERRYQGTHESLTDEQFALGIAKEFALKALSVDFDNPRKNAVRQRVVVSDFGRPIEVVGIRSTYRFEFEGDESLLYLRPSTFGSQLPRAEIQGSSITIAFDSRDSEDPENVKRELEKTRDLLRENLSNQAKQIAQHNQELIEHVGPRVEARRRSIERLKNFQDAI